MDQAIIDKVKADNPGAELQLLRDHESGIEILARVPSEPEWKRFRAMQQSDEQAHLAPRALVLGSIVYPSPADFAAQLAKLPGLSETFCRPLVKLAGVSAAASAEKV